MKRLYTILTACLLLAACESEEMGQEAVGYLTLAVGTDKTTLTKAEDEYNPKQIAVKIVNSAWENDFQNVSLVPCNKMTWDWIDNGEVTA